VNIRNKNSVTLDSNDWEHLPDSLAWLGFVGGLQSDLEKHTVELE